MVDKRLIFWRNVLKRKKQDIRQSSRPLGMFPSIELYFRLDTAYLIEYTEDRTNENANLKTDKLGRG
jgi:hypothetical protein